MLLLEDKSFENTKYYTYIYLDPRKPGKYIYEEFSFEFEPFYVGAGHGNRYLFHIIEAHTKYKLEDMEKMNKHKRNKILKIERENKTEPIILKLKENITELEAFNFEILLIAKIGRINVGTGPLTNLTPGGDGKGKKMPPEAIEKLRKILTGRKVSPEHAAKNRLAFKGKTHTKETKKRMSESQKARHKAHPMTEESKQQISKTHYIKKEAGFKPNITDEARRKMSIPWKGKKRPEETIKKMSAWQKGKPKSEAHKKALKEAHKNNKGNKPLSYIIFKDENIIVPKIVGLKQVKEWCKYNNVNFNKLHFSFRKEQSYLGFRLKRIEI
jgi:hypothetical protein